MGKIFLRKAKEDPAVHIANAKDLQKLAQKKSLAGGEWPTSPRQALDKRGNVRTYQII